MKNGGRLLLMGLVPLLVSVVLLVAARPAGATPTLVSATDLERAGADGVRTVVTNGGSSTVTTIDFYPNGGVTVTGGSYTTDDGASGACGHNSTLASCVVSLTTGHKATITVTTSPSVPDGAGAKVSAGDGTPPPVDINVGGPTAPCPTNPTLPRPCADLTITNVSVLGWRASNSEQCIHPRTIGDAARCDIALARPQAFFGPSESAIGLATIRNNGPDSANRCSVSLFFLPNFGSQGCAVGILPPMYSVTGPRMFGVMPAATGAQEFKASVSADPFPDPIPANNSFTGEITTLAAPAPRAAQAGSDGARGTLRSSSGHARGAGNARAAAPTRVTHVDVAFLLAPKRGAAKCMWVKNARARFAGVAPTNRVCDRPIWLRARGTSKWSYKLSRKLPKGRYLLYVRAVDAGGVWDDVYSTAKHNKQTFTVR